MCVGWEFSNIQSVKVIGPKIGRGSVASMRDGDGDGKCQEEDGKWIPCPPGVGDGNVIDAAGRAVRTIGESIGKKPDSKPEPAHNTLTKAREKAAAKAAKIASAAQMHVPKERRAKAKELADLLEEYHSARSRAERREIVDNIHDAASEIFSHEITGLDGKQYKVEVHNVSYSYDVLNFDGSIYQVQEDGTLKDAGTFARNIETMSQRAIHESLFVREPYQDAGLASTINARNEILYKEMGITHIDTEGLSNKDYKGATHWPKNGYNWSNLRSQTEFIATIQAAINFHKNNNVDGKSDYFDSNEQADEVAALLKEASAQAMRVTGPEALTAADLLNWPGAEDWFKRTHSIISYSRKI